MNLGLLNIFFKGGEERCRMSHSRKSLKTAQNQEKAGFRPHDLQLSQCQTCPQVYIKAAQGLLWKLGELPSPICALSSWGRECRGAIITILPLLGNAPLAGSTNFMQFCATKSVQSYLERLEFLAHWALVESFISLQSRGKTTGVV